MLQIGKYKIIHSCQFICPSSESAKITFTFEDVPIAIIVRFTTDDQNKGNAKILLSSQDNSPTISLSNWDSSPFGIATQFPYQIGLIKGKKLSVAAFGNNVGGDTGRTHKIFIQFMVEDADAE